MAKRERAVLVGVAVPAVPRTEVVAHLDELAQLVDTAGGEVAARLVQERKSPDPATFIGKGKVSELSGLVTEHGGDQQPQDEHRVEVHVALLQAVDRARLPP
jgi:GTP-binding protein HflX